MLFSKMKLDKHSKLYKYLKINLLDNICSKIYTENVIYLDYLRKV